MSVLLATALLSAIAATASAGPAKTRLTPDLARAEALQQFDVDSPDAWAVEQGALVLKVAGKPGGPIRKPSRWAVLNSDPLGSVSLRARVRCDQAVERKGRDLLLLFGYQSPRRFYYVHLSNETTYPHNGIFLVNDADRKRLDEMKSVPRLQDREWHEVRLVRDVQKGTVEVYFDGGDQPVLSANDKTLVAGRIGFGSFDDTAAFKDIVVEGEKAKKK